MIATAHNSSSDQDMTVFKNSDMIMNVVQNMDTQIRAR